MKLLLKAGFPIVSISNQKRQAYIETLTTAQQSEADLMLLLNLICEAVYEALVETLAIVSGAGDSRGKGLPFYQEVVDFLDDEPCK